MSKLTIERIGGLAGFGGANSHVQSRGEINIEELSKEDKKIVEDLFISQSKIHSKIAMDTFRYKISRMTSKGIESIEAEEEKIPHIVRQCLRDEII